MSEHYATADSEWPQIEGPPLLRPPLGSERRPAASPWELEATLIAFHPALAGKQSRREYYLRLWLPRLRQRRANFVIVAATLALSCLVGIAISAATG